jgi:ADP-ribose pyrophosphatase YjhB (NUDIX family)
MITFDRPTGRFGYRVAGIAVHAGHVLLHRAATDSFWSLPGGRCELQESSGLALARELREECATPVTVERLVWVAELFFGPVERRWHELGFYYLVSFPPGSPWLDVNTTFAGAEESLPLVFQWFPLAAAAQLPLYPLFLRSRLHRLPPAVEHIVSDEAPDGSTSTTVGTQDGQRHDNEAAGPERL